MKQFVLAALVALAGHAANAQCDKTLFLQSSKTLYLDIEGNVKKEKDEHTTIELSKTQITISPEYGDVMNGTIRSSSCEWKIPFKEGRTEMKATIEDKGKTMDVTIRIEGKDGRVSFTVAVDSEPEKRVRVWLDKFSTKG